ncbi:hypothetical protein [Microscilla marina]|uniref:Phosphate-selective porin O and P superfamily n=1 Tax=Microscilla marina ATCC 23134 TaxID=313606 RepID=A1ZSN2_MICM2|nr:hypothetical protein [Microscilla marina]EAY26612.1 conserved hypothetical protein [Microscilla marina ATCC 23134]
MTRSKKGYYTTFLFFLMLQLSGLTFAQNPLLDDGKIKFRLNKNGSHYVRLTFLNQVWVRYNENNPGTTNGITEPNTFDIGLRRTRLQLFGQITDQVFFYTQFGQNNFSYQGPRKSGAFFHDALIEYHTNRAFHLGMGLTAWTGFARYASPSIGSLLALDTPLFQQSTADQTDQFLRKLSIYAKGQVGKIDYRVALSKPLAVYDAPTTATNFSADPPQVQSQAYVKYQLMEHESNRTPYNTGSYLGTKKVFTIGGGIIYQPNAMWRLNNNASDTIRQDLTLWAVDAFFDYPLSEQGNAITAYAGFFSTDMGFNYFRNVGVMNPAIGANTSINGSGNGFPMIGSGNTVYSQVGYLFNKDLLGKYGTLQPFGVVQYSNYDAFKDAVIMWELGANWLIKGHQSKMSMVYQNRPVFTTNSAGESVNTESKGMWVLQYQVNF